MKPNTIVILIVTLLIAALGYWYFSSAASGNQPPLSAGAEANPAQATFETLVSELQPITFDTAVFSDPRFNALVDISTSVTPEPSGRPDPFAFIAGVGK